MIIPRFLREGDRIGVTAPSFGVTDPTDIARFGHAKERLSSMGLDVVETPDVYTADGTGRSAPAEQRVAELNSLLGDPDVAAVISAKGGDYQCEMLPLMDWDLLEGNPKWMQGYSDNTTLLFRITAEHDIATVYGGNFGDFGMEPWHRSVTESLEFLRGMRTSQDSFPMHEVGFSDRVTGLEPLDPTAPTVWRSTEGDTSFSGRLIGGCMDVLEWDHKVNGTSLKGFNDLYSDEGIVWYMETYDMDAVRIRDMLSGMSEDGWFQGVTGFVFGRPLFYDGPDYMEVVTDVLGEYDVPMVFDADVGHKAPRMTFINGAMSRFDIRDGRCHLEYTF